MIRVNASHLWRDSAATVVFMRRRFAVIGRTAGKHEPGKINGRVGIRALNEIKAVGRFADLTDHCGGCEAVY